MHNYFSFGSRSVKKPVAGVAHHVSFMRPYGLFDVAAVTLANSLTLFHYVDSICDKLDFIGINYYGQVCPFKIKTINCSYKSNVKQNWLVYFTGGDFWAWVETCRKRRVQWIWTRCLPWRFIPYSAWFPWKVQTPKFAFYNHWEWSFWRDRFDPTAIYAWASSSHQCRHENG